MSMRMLPAAKVCLSLLSVPSLYDLESEGDEPYGSHGIERPVWGQGESREVGVKPGKQVDVAPPYFLEARHEWEGKQEGVEFRF